MIKFSRRPYYKRSFPRSRRPRWLSWRWIAIALPLGLLVLEILLRLLFDFGDGRQFYGSDTPFINAHRLQFLTETGEPIAAFPDGGNLKIQRNFAVGFQLTGNQKSKFWNINEQGFRDLKAVPLAKPKDEIRIFFLGGSAAFGQWSQGNGNTISSKLEALLNQRIAAQRQSPQTYQPDILPPYRSEQPKALARTPKIRDGQYRVINAAVPGYSSGNELAQLALQILPYRPDAIVVMDGYADIMLPSSATATEIPHLDRFLADASAHYSAQLNLAWSNWLGQLYLIQAPRRWFFPPQLSLAEQVLPVTQPDSLEQALPADDAELSRRITRYQGHQIQLAQLCSGARIPLLLVLQPEITSRPPETLSLKEEEMRKQLGNTYLESLPKAYARLASAATQLQQGFPKTVTVLNFYEQTQKFPTPAFLDPIHLESETNTAIAQSLYNTFLNLPAIKVIPRSPEN